MYYTSGSWRELSGTVKKVRKNIVFVSVQYLSQKIIDLKKTNLKKKQHFFQKKTVY